MAQFFGIVTLPDGIDGRGADAGKVWTADGANGAGWQDAAGGGWSNYIELTEEDENLTLTANDSGTLVRCMSYYENITPHQIYLPPATIGLQYLLVAMTDEDNGSTVIVHANGSDLLDICREQPSSSVLVAGVIFVSIVSQFVGYSGGWLVLPNSRRSFDDGSHCYWQPAT